MPKVPNFIYIGPDKAGSSWLHEVLLRHDQVFMPEAKDLYFFDRYYDRGQSWYAGQFGAARPDHVVIGEVCQDYLFAPKAPARIAESLTNVRFMVTLRDPADRAFSSYLYMRKHGEGPSTFLEALESDKRLLEHGRYATHLSRFVDRFGRDSIHVAVFDDLVASPQQFIDHLLSWLGIRPMVLPADLLEARLPAGRARSIALARAVRRCAEIARERNGADLVGRIKRSSLVQKSLYKTLTDDKPGLTQQERDVVRNALTSEITELDRMFGLGLGQRWGWPPASVPTVPGSGRAPAEAPSTGT